MPGSVAHSPARTIASKWEVHVGTVAVVGSCGCSEEGQVACTGRVGQHVVRAVRKGLVEDGV